MFIVAILAPIFLLIAMGYLLRARGFADNAFFWHSNRLVYWVGLPCLLFDETARSALPGGSTLRIAAVLLGTMALGIVAGYLGARFLRVKAGSRGAFVQIAYRGNLAFVGLPVVLFWLEGRPGGGDSGLAAVALLVLAPTIPAYNIAGVLILLGDGRAKAAAGSRWRQLAVNVASNPLVLACLAGMAWSWSGVALPGVVHRTMALLGATALPLALLGVGASLDREAVHGQLRPALGATLLKTVAAPALGAWLCRLGGLSPEETVICMLYLATPVAVASLVMAQNLGSDHKLTAAGIVLSTLLALPAMATVLWLAGR